MSLFPPPAAGWLLQLSSRHFSRCFRHMSFFPLPPVDCCCFCHYIFFLPDDCRRSCHCCFLGRHCLIVAVLSHCWFFSMPLDCRFFVTCHFFCRLLIVTTSSFLSLLLFLVTAGWLLPLLPLFLLLFKNRRKLIVAAFLSHPVDFLNVAAFAIFVFVAGGWLLPLCLAPLLERRSVRAVTSPRIRMRRVASRCRPQVDCYFLILTPAPTSSVRSDTPAPA